MTLLPDCDIHFRDNPSCVHSWAYLEGGTGTAPPPIAQVFALFKLPNMGTALYKSTYLRQQWTATPAEQRLDTATAALNS